MAKPGWGPLLPLQGDAPKFCAGWWVCGWVCGAGRSGGVLNLRTTILADVAEKTTNLFLYTFLEENTQRKIQ